MSCAGFSSEVAGHGSSSLTLGNSGLHRDAGSPPLCSTISSWQAALNLTPMATSDAPTW